MAKSEYYYDASPATLRNPLSPLEINQIVSDQGSAFLKNRPALLHLLNRVSLTIEQYRAQVNQLSDDIQRFRLARESAGRASGLSPLENAKFAPPEELARLVDEQTRERFLLASRALEAAGDVRETVVREYNRLRFAATSLSEDESLDPRVRQRFATLLTQDPPSDLRDAVAHTEEALAQVEQVLPRDTTPPPTDPSDLAALFS